MVHIIVGVPEPVYLQRALPKWHDIIGFYNPTTILWRYFSLVDRRIRAKQWKRLTWLQVIPDLGKRQMGWFGRNVRDKQVVLYQDTEKSSNLIYVSNCSRDSDNHAARCTSNLRPRQGILWRLAEFSLNDILSIVSAWVTSTPCLILAFRRRILCCCSHRQYSS